MKLSDKIYDAILGNLNDRKGFNYWYHGINEDVKAEMKAEVSEVIASILSEDAKDEHA